MHRGAVRKLALFSVLASVIAVVALDRPREVVGRDSTAKMPATAAPVPVGRGGDAVFDAGALPQRAALGKTRGDLFASPAARRLPQAHVAAPAPQAPPLPFRFAGVTVVGGERQVYLSKGRAVFEVKQGAILDGAYRVDSVEPAQVRLTYLPLQKQELVAIASVLPAARPSALPPAAARVAWTGPSQVRVGAPFKVALRVDSSQAVHAMPMRLRFDPQLLEPLGVAPGSFFLHAGRRFVTRLDPGGSIFVGASKASAAPAADAELIVLTLRAVKAAPAAELRIAALDLQGAGGKSIALAALPSYRTEITP